MAVIIENKGESPKVNQSIEFTKNKNTSQLSIDNMSVS